MSATPGASPPLERSGHDQARPNRSVSIIATGRRCLWPNTTGLRISAGTDLLVFQLVALEPPVSRQ